MAKSTTAAKTITHVLTDAADECIGQLRAKCARAETDLEQCLDETHAERIRLRETRLAHNFPDPDTIKDTKGDDAGAGRAFARVQEQTSDAIGASAIRRALKSIDRLEREAHRLVKERDYLRALADDGPGASAKHTELAALAAVSFEAHVGSLLPVLANVAAARAALVEAVEIATAKLGQRNADAERVKVLATELRIEVPAVRCLSFAAAVSLLPPCASNLAPWVTSAGTPRARLLAVAEAVGAAHWFANTSPTIREAIGAFGSDEQILTSLIAEPHAFDAHVREHVGRAESELRARREATYDNAPEGPPFAA